MIQQLGMTVAYYCVFILITLVTALVFSCLTRYNDWEEIRKGNLAAAMALGGKVFGIGNIVHYTILTNDTMAQAVTWSGIGLVLLILVYLLFEWLTPRLNVNEEIGAGNKAVGFISLIFSVTASFIIGASIA